MRNIIKMYPTSSRRRCKSKPDKKTHDVDFAKKIGEYKRFLSKDKDFDYADVLSLLKYKLRRTRENLAAHANFPQAGEVSHEIRKVERLLQRVIDDKYEKLARRRLERKYGDKLYASEDMPDEIKQALSATAEDAFMARRADLKDAFDIILDKIWYWWCY